MLLFRLQHLKKNDDLYRQSRQLEDPPHPESVSRLGGGALAVVPGGGPEWAECCPSRVRPVGPPWGVATVDILPPAARIPPPVVARDMVDDCVCGLGYYFLGKGEIKPAKKKTSHWIKDRSNDKLKWYKR